MTKQEAFSIINDPQKIDIFAEIISFLKVTEPNTESDLAFLELEENLKQ